MFCPHDNRKHGFCFRRDDKGKTFVAYTNICTEYWDRLRNMSCCLRRSQKVVFFFTLNTSWFVCVCVYLCRSDQMSQVSILRNLSRVAKTANPLHRNWFDPGRISLKCPRRRTLKVPRLLKLIRSHPLRRASLAV